MRYLASTSAAGWLDVPLVELPPDELLLEGEDELLEAGDVVRLLLAVGPPTDATGPKPWIGCDSEALPKPGIDDPLLAAAPVEPLAEVLLEPLPPVNA